MANESQRIEKETMRKIDRTEYTYPHSIRLGHTMALATKLLVERGVDVLDMGAVKGFEDLIPRLRGHEEEVARIYGRVHDSGRPVVTEMMGPMPERKADPKNPGKFTWGYGKKPGHWIWDVPNPTPEEWEVIRDHANQSKRFVTRLGRKTAEFFGALSGLHHEDFNGGGYPGGTRGKDVPLRAIPFVERLSRMRVKIRGRKIPVLARLARVLDSFDAAMFPRAHSGSTKQRSAEETMGMLEKYRGTWYDPKMLDLVNEMVAKKQITLAKLRAITPKKR